MKPKSQIIAEQESIGNVEITEEEYNRLTGDGEMRIWINNTYLNFAPREVVHPEEKIGCGVKIMSVNGKDIKCGEFALGKIRYCNHCHECQKKQDAKDNHTSPQEVNVSKPQHKVETGEATADKEPLTDTCVGTDSPNDYRGSDIQASKIFEDVIKLINEMELFEKQVNKEQGWDEWAEARCYSEIRNKLINLKEKWGKIER